MLHNPAFSFDYGTAQFCYGCDDETAQRISCGTVVDRATTEYAYQRVSDAWDREVERRATAELMAMVEPLRGGACNCIDCGGTASEHASNCEYMRDLHGGA